MQVPWTPGCAQDSQAPVQAVLQQTPPEQNPLLHWVLWVQATPLPAGGTHWPAELQVVPGTQSASVVHAVVVMFSILLAQQRFDAVGVYARFVRRPRKDGKTSVLRRHEGEGVALVVNELCCCEVACAAEL